MLLDVADRLEIHELAARYGKAVDDRDWEALARVFTPDALFVIGRPDGSEERHPGFDAIRALMTAGPHPVAHHVTNVIIDADDNNTARLFFKVIAPGHRGRAGSADYYDQVVRTADGWRIREHLVTIRPTAPTSPRTEGDR